MKWKYILCFLALSHAGALHATTKKKVYLKLIEANKQRTIPGIPGATPKTNYDFVITWENANFPETFFWRGDDGWLPCKMMRAHKTTSKKNPGGYAVEYITNGMVHKGDTLELIPVAGGKFPIPPEIPSTTKNTLFFKAGGNGWLSFPIKNIVEKPDIVQP